MEKTEGILELVPIYDLFMLVKPFSEIFSDRKEAEKAFEFLKHTLNLLRVNDAEDSEFHLSIKLGLSIHPDHLLELLKVIGVESFEDFRYQEIVALVDPVTLVNDFCFSKWILTLDFKGWRVCTFSHPPEWKLIVPFVGTPKITSKTAPKHHRIPELLKGSNYRVPTKHLMTFPWTRSAKTAYEEALDIYRGSDQNGSPIEQSPYHQTLAEAVFDLQKLEDLLCKELPGWTEHEDKPAAQVLALVKQKPSGRDLTTPPLKDIQQRVAKQGLRIDDRLLRRYHLALQTRKFVILSGVSGTGKTWLTQAYAEAINAEYQLVPVAPNWTTNEDLLGYFNPITLKYHDTDFNRFLREAATEYRRAKKEERLVKPYHLVLDEMNLARVEYYFAKFLSVMEVRMRQETAGEEILESELLTPNLYFIGTVNVDETTHGFADKVYDRAQLIELTVDGPQLEEYLVKEACDKACVEVLMQVWDAVHFVAPFAFRVMDEIVTYVKQAEKLSVPWNEALDEQLLQKVLPKFKGVDSRVEKALENFLVIAEKNKLELSVTKAKDMLNKFQLHGFTSYFQ
ncbi:AAA family ATPase [Microcoleus sp. K1-B6]|uniref:AAA family ATPase n=1 Tax=unclassified Microcoleus TaxID=2642155 RepID=UPI002FD78035